MGSTLQSTLKAEYNITFQWWWFMVFLILFVGLHGLARDRAVGATC